MKFIIDNPLSPYIAEALRSAGFDAVHVADYDMQAAEDIVIFQRAVAEDRIIISADTDFGTLLALWNQTKPSVMLFRRSSRRKPVEQANFLLTILEQVRSDLEAGSIVIIEEYRLRIRSLPIQTM